MSKASHLGKEGDVDGPQLGASEIKITEVWRVLEKGRQMVG